MGIPNRHLNGFKPQAFRRHPRCSLLLIRGRTKEAFTILQEDGWLHVRDSHRPQQVDIGGTSEDSLHWLVERYAGWFTEAPDEHRQPDYYYEMHNRIDVTIILPPTGFPHAAQEKGTAGGSLGTTYNPFEGPQQEVSPVSIPTATVVVEGVPIAKDESTPDEPQATL